MQKRKNSEESSWLLISQNETFGGKQSKHAQSKHAIDPRDTKSERLYFCNRRASEKVQSAQHHYGGCAKLNRIDVLTNYFRVTQQGSPVNWFNCLQAEMTLAFCCLSVHHHHKRSTQR